MPATSLNATQIDSDPGGFCGLPLVPIIPLKGSPAWWLLAPRSLSPLVPDFREISAVRKTNLCFWVAQFLSTVRYFILMCLWIHHKIIFAHWMLEITCNWSKKKKKTGVGGGGVGSDLALIPVMMGKQEEGWGMHSSIHPHPPFIHYSFKQDSVTSSRFYIIPQMHILFKIKIKIQAEDLKKKSLPHGAYV